MELDSINRVARGETGAVAPQNDREKRKEKKEEKGRKREERGAVVSAPGDHEGVERGG